MKILINACVIIILMSGCTPIMSPITNYNKLEQPDNKILIASVGSAIFRMNKSADLPNIYGKADIYGGKVDKGFTELKFKGVKDDGKVVLQVVDINKSSTETTMDRYLYSNVNFSANSSINIGEDSSPDITIFEFDPQKEKNLTISGVTITFIEVSAYSIKYQLKKEI